ncbi:MAG: helix-turn-helix transcriptional regulator [Nodosilinea sp.]
MAKPINSHPYSDRAAFERLMLLIATLGQHPGLGCPKAESSGDDHHDAIEPIQQALAATAASLGFALSAYAAATLRKDLASLRQYGILGPQMYRWGYYLGVGALSLEELKLALDAISTLANNLSDPTFRQLQATLHQRFKTLDRQHQGQLFCPTRHLLNRAIHHTDPNTMVADGINPNSIFHQLPGLEAAITEHQAIELSRREDVYDTGRVGPERLWPLQLVYHDIAWYLLYENYTSGHFVVGRLSRFGNYCRPLSNPPRSTTQHQTQLAAALDLLENGWGLYLGEPAEQQAERQGTLALERVRVRFFPPVVAFILEGRLRHRRQRVVPGPKDDQGHYRYVDYVVQLPPRSLDECSRWVNRHLHHAQVLGPAALVERHREAALALAARYGGGRVDS